MESKKENKISFGHIINPVQINKKSDLSVAQTFTFETMRVAREFSRETNDVNLYAVQYHDEESISLPPDFIRLPDLTRSILDIKEFKQKKKLPLIKDILDSLYEAAETNYLIYTNADIALQPYFYQSVSQIISKGCDAFVINRRTIPAHYGKDEDIPLMYSEIGESHPGYDCFVFNRNLYPHFKLGNICIGTAWIGRALLANMVAYASKFKEFRNVHLTFHIGDSVQWRREEYHDYFQENQKEYLGIFKQLESERGEFHPDICSYLLDTGGKRNIPDFDNLYSEKGKYLRS